MKYLLITLIILFPLTAFGATPIRVPAVRFTAPRVYTAPSIPRSVPIRVPSVNNAPRGLGTRTAIAPASNLANTQSSLSNYSYNPFSANFLLWAWIFNRPNKVTVDCSKDQNKDKDECKKK